MVIAVFIFFFTQKLLLNAFFSTTVVVFFITVTHKNLITKVLDSIPHTLTLNLFGELFTLALAKD